MPLPTVVAIDGPVASGKTVVGNEVARRLGYRFIDTGLMYRAITWLALRDQIPLEDETALGRLAQNTTVTIEANGLARVLANGAEVTPHLRLPEVDAAVSMVSQVAGVRRAMVAQQRRMAAEAPVVMVGRDIGTNVLPDAPAKLFLEASAEERGRRRHRDLQASGLIVSYQEVLTNMELRDTIDSQRTEAPLRPAEDAVLVATDGLSEEEVVERVMEVVCDR